MIGSFTAFGAVERRSASPRTPAPRPDRRAAGDPGRVHAGQRHAEHADRARGLPAVAQRAEARAADHRRRLLLHPPERRHPVAGRLPAQRPRPDRLAGASCSTSSGCRSPAGPAGDRGTVPLVFLLTAFIGAQPPRQGDARHRAGPRGGAADGHQRRHDDLADLPARRPAGRRGRAHQRALQHRSGTSRASRPA